MLHGDSLTILRTIPASSMGSVVCDPPYAIRTGRDVRASAVRPHGAVHPPGGFEGDHAVTCARCSVRDAENGITVCAARLRELEIEDFADAGMLGQQSANWHESATHSRGYADNDPAAFQRWCYLWTRECLRVLKPGGHLVAFGGTRTWHRLASAAEDAGFEIRDSLAWLYGTGFPKSVDVSGAIARQITREEDAATSALAPVDATSMDSWEGWGTALKPAHEPIVFARKPLTGTVARNVLACGTGALNIGGCRIRSAGRDGSRPPAARVTGRWPTNVFFDASQGEALDEQAHPNPASRFFWVAKPSSAERVSVNGVVHPTVKPVELMRELVRLVTPPGGVVLDPFAGSGTTVEACLLEGLRCVAIERDADYLPLIKARIDRAHRATASAEGSDQEPELEALTLFTMLPSTG